MSPTELAKLIDFMEDRWPSTRNWRHADRIAHDFSGLQDANVWEAARNHYNAGNRNAPTPSELKHAASEIQRGKAGMEADRQNCEKRGRHSRNWAIADLDKTNDKGQPLREGQCVDCGTIIIRPAHQLLTVGEAVEQEKEHGAPADPLADAIAP